MHSLWAAEFDTGMLWASVSECMFDSQCSRSGACVSGDCYPYCLDECIYQDFDCGSAGVCTPPCQTGNYSIEHRGTSILQVIRIEILSVKNSRIIGKDWKKWKYTLKVTTNCEPAVMTNCCSSVENVRLPWYPMAYTMMLSFQRETNLPLQILNELNFYSSYWCLEMHWNGIPVTLIWCASLDLPCFENKTQSRESQSNSSLKHLCYPCRQWLWLEAGMLSKWYMSDTMYKQWGLCLWPILWWWLLHRRSGSDWLSRTWIL